VKTLILRFDALEVVEELILNHAERIDAAPTDRPRPGCDSRRAEDHSQR
jgi:hypothetical protein